MDANKFLSEFSHIAGAPNGVERLRSMVLQLAISGGLVPPELDSNKLESEFKSALIAKKEYENQYQLRKSKRVISKSTIDFKLPSSWKVVELDDIALYIQRGKGPKYTESSACRVISQKCIQWNGFDLKPARFIKEETIDTYGQERFLMPGDILWNSTGTGTVGRVNIYSETDESIQTVADSHVTVIRLANTNPKFLWCVLASPWIQQRIVPEHAESLVSGTTKQVELNTSTVKALKIPLPSTDEQAKIVAKVEELMSLCDKLEEQQQQKRHVQNQLRQASLRALAEASSPFELKQHWQRVRVNFSSLFSSAEDTVDFSDHIKELAVKGLLCRSVFNVADIERARGQRTELLNCYLEKKLMRKQKSVSVAESDVEYPTNWQVVAFDEIALVTGGVTKGRKLKDREFISCPYLAVANVQRGFFNLTNLKTIDIPVDEIEKYAVQPGDLLITEGGDWDKVGRTAIWRSNVDNCLHQNHVFKVRVPSGEVLNEWVELVFNSMVGRSYFAGASKQTTNLASINMTQLRSFPFPVPPLSQQIEIINIVGTLNKLCSVWKEKYERLNDLSSLFVKEAIANFTGVNTVKKEEPLKVPKTELVSPITLGLNKPSGKDDAPLATLLARQSGRMNASDLWQRFGGEIDAFYAQLKVEVAHGWIAEPETANMLEKDEE